MKINLEKEARCTIERLRSLLEYSSDTGLLTWKVWRGGKAKPGTIAGSVSDDGYVYLSIDRNTFAAHRVAWAMHFGKWPDHLVDHENGIKSDNRIGNLRSANHVENGQNQTMDRPRKKSTKLIGAYRCGGDKWRAIIRVNKTSVHLGVFDSDIEANKAYLAAKANLHPFYQSKQGHQ